MGRMLRGFLAEECSPAYYAMRLFVAGELGWEDLEQREIDERLGEIGEVVDMAEILEGKGV